MSILADAHLEAALRKLREGAQGCLPIELLPSDAAALLVRLEAASQALQDVIAERFRQISAEGWTPQHDDRHPGGAIAVAAGCYAMYADSYPNTGQPPPMWPWEKQWWKPKNYRRDLVRSAALIVAEIERLDRNPQPAAEGKPVTDGTWDAVPGSWWP